MSIKSKSKLKEDIFKYISKKSKNVSIENLLDLAKENIIKNIKNIYGGSESSIENAMDDLENDDDIEIISIEKDIYICKEDKSLRQKLKNLGILPFMQKINILMASLILSFILLLYVSFFTLSNEINSFLGGGVFLTIFTLIFFYILKYVPKYLIKLFRVGEKIKSKKHISYILFAVGIVLIIIAYLLSNVNAIIPLLIEISFGLGMMLYDK